jgi:hypothetical protein
MAYGKQLLTAMSSPGMTQEAFYFFMIVGGSI